MSGLLDFGTGNVYLVSQNPVLAAPYAKSVTIMRYGVMHYGSEKE